MTTTPDWSMMKFFEAFFSTLVLLALLAFAGALLIAGNYRDRL